jgi:hypothetical protein
MIAKETAERPATYLGGWLFVHYHSVYVAINGIPRRYCTFPNINRRNNYES